MQYTKEEIRKRILNSAKTEFLEFGFEKANIRRIVHRSKISLGNLYRYYKNKTQLYDAVVNPVIEKCLQNINSLELKKENFKSIAFHMANFSDENMDIFKILQKGIYEHYNSFLNKFAEEIANKIKNEINFSKQNSLMVKILSVSFINGIRTIMENYSLKEEAQNQIETLLNIMLDDIENKLK